MLAGSEIVVGVSGGIAAYKTAALVSRLVQAGGLVTVAMSRDAKRFVGPATFAALTGRPVVTRLFGNEDRFPLGAHIELARQAKLFVVAPATANFIAKAAHGMADDLLSTLYLAYAGTTLVAPAMNTEMWDKPVVQRNVAQLTADGVIMVPPTEGWLSCRTRGAGRMAEPDTIFAAIESLLGDRQV